MAELENAHLKVTISWDVEPSDEAKAFIAAEVAHTLEALLSQRGWLANLVRRELSTAMREPREPTWVRVDTAEPSETAHAVSEQPPIMSRDASILGGWEPWPTR